MSIKNRLRPSRTNTKPLQYLGLAIVLIIVVGFTTNYLLGQTTIYNRPEVDPIENVLTVFDSEGTDITDTFDTATIANSVTFEVQFTSGWDRIHGVTLVVEGTSEDASPGGYWVFEKVAGSVTTWMIVFDTVQLNNGEYDFDFYYTEEMPPLTFGGDPEIFDTMFSSFQFDWTDGEGILSQITFPMWLLAIMVVAILSTITITGYVMARRKKDNRRKGR